MSKNAVTPVTTHDDGEFCRTALVIDGKSGDLDLVDASGKRLALISVNWTHGRDLSVDVIGIDMRFTKRRALAFGQGGRADMDVPNGGTIVCVHFEIPAGHAYRDTKLPAPQMAALRFVASKAKTWDAFSLSRTKPKTTSFDALFKKGLIDEYNAGRKLTQEGKRELTECGFNVDGSRR